MGISDEEYRAALIQQHMKAHLAYLEKQQMEKEAKMAGLLSSVGNIGGAGTSTPYPANLTSTTISTNATNAVWENRSPLGIKTLNEQDLQHDAMKAPLSALIDMWTMRWQGEWVSETEFQEDDFWRLALIRLTGANKLEKHHLASSYYAVYRIIE